MKNYQHTTLRQKLQLFTLNLYKAGLLCFFLFCSFSPRQQKDKASEYNLKAAFIYNFTKYVDWKSGSNDNEFIIGIIGTSPIIDPLTEIVKTETVDNKRISLKQFAKPGDISFCHILFISQNAATSLDAILAKVANKGTLIVSEQDGYAEQGTAFNFVILNNKLKFEANLKALNTAGLTASSQLLKLAIIIK
jgi:hypothetical protein